MNNNFKTVPSLGPGICVTNQAIFNEVFPLQGYDTVSSGKVNKSF
jgi:hypothetical protein